MWGCLCVFCVQSVSILSEFLVWCHLQLVVFIISGPVVGENHGVEKVESLKELVGYMKTHQTLVLHLWVGS